MSVAIQPDLFEATRRRDSAMSWVERNANQAYRARLIEAIEVLAASGYSFCSDQVRVLAGDPPADCSPNIAGAVINHAAKAGLIEFVGYTRSTRVIGHRNLVRLWTGRQIRKSPATASADPGRAHDLVRLPDLAELVV